MKAILINAETRSFSTVEIKSWKDIAPAIGAELFEIVTIEQNDALYVDEEGLMKPQDNFILYDGYPQPLAGNALVLGTDDEGESTDPKNTLEFLKGKIRFMNRYQAREYAIKNDV